MDYAEIIRYIRKIKKDIKKGRHNSLDCGTYISIMEDPGYRPLEIAARFLRRKGYAIDIRVRIVHVGHVCFGSTLECHRYVFINY